MNRGFTIIEMMVVIVLIAIVVTGVAMGLGATRAGQLQSSAWRLVSAVRYAYSRAVSEGTTVRLVIDFEGRSIQIQETTGRVVLNRDDETGVGLNREDDETAYLADGSIKEGDLKSKMKRIGPVVTGQSVSDETSGQMGEMAITDAFLKAVQGQGGALPKYRGPRFETIEGKRGKKRKLDGKIGFLRVFSPHAPVAIEEGFAFIYFFPSGQTEHTLIQLSDFDEDEPTVNTIEIHPLTGRAQIIHEELEPTGDLVDMQEVEGR